MIRVHTAAPTLKTMQRVLIIGSGGAGKSILAKALAERTGLPLFDLDRLYWQPRWVDTSRDGMVHILRSPRDIDAFLTEI